MYERILAPIDGSTQSLKALNHAVELAKKHGSEIMVISVVDSLKLPFGAEYSLWANESHQELIRTTLESINKEITDIKQQKPELSIDAMVIEGDPAKQILRIAEEEGYNVIVMGKRGMGLIEELVMGSVTHKVVNHSMIPVIVVA
jgi:nucleotide-binding universal stress UspA family protein